MCGGGVGVVVGWGERGFVSSSEVWEEEGRGSSVEKHMHCGCIVTTHTVLYCTIVL